MASDTNGLRLLDQMLLGYPELSWMQAEINERQAWMRLAMAHECGWVGEWIGGNPNFGWEVYDSGSGVLAIRSVGADGSSLFYDKTRGNTARPFVGIDRAGQVLQLFPGATLLEEDGSDLTVPNDGVWYTLLCEYHLTKLEPGTLNFTGGSTTVTGVGTQFTRYAQGSEPGEPTLLRVDATDTVQGNEGSYTIATITNDTTLTLTAAPSSTETGIDFRVRGRFAAGVPADPDTRWNASVKWSLVARTTTRPTTALVAYDVRRSGGTVTVIDRRYANIWRPMDGRTHRIGLVGRVAFNQAEATTTNYTAQVRTFSYSLASTVGSRADVIAIALAPCTPEGAIFQIGMMAAVLWDDASTRHVRIVHFNPLNSGAQIEGLWTDPGGSPVTVLSANGMLDVALVRVPFANGATHILFYVTSAGLVVQRTSADNGETWGSATTIWDASVAGTATKISACKTRMGKLVLVATRSTGNLLRFIYSNDYGATWDTNSQAGYSSAVSNGAVAADVSIVEDDRGNLWTAAADGTNTGVTLFRGPAEGDAVPTLQEMVVPSGGWAIGPDTSTAVSYFDMIPFPDGSIGVVYGRELSMSDSSVIGYLQTARRLTLSHQVLVRSPITAPIGTAEKVPLAAGVDVAGQVHVVWGDAASGFNLTLRSAIYTPIEMPRTLVPTGS